MSPANEQDAPLVAAAFSRRENVRLWGAFALGLVGIAGSFATIYASPVEKAAVLPCGVKLLNCANALSAPVSHLGGVPLGVLGVFYFMFWTMNLREYHRTGQDEYQTALTWGTALGALVSLSLFTYMFGVLRSPCLYCLLTHSSNLGAVALLYPFRRFRLPDFTTNEVWHFAAMTAIAVLAASTTYFANAHRIALARIARLSQGVVPVAAAAEEACDFRAIKDLPAALARARAEGRHVLVFVHHPSCGGCREFRGHVYGTPAFAAFAARRLVRVVVNAADADLSELSRLPVPLSRRIEPSMYPALALVAPDGRVAFWDEGLTDYLTATPERVIALLEERMAPPAPPLTVKGLNTGKEASLAPGRVTLLDFWATWCAACDKSLPSLQALYAKYQPRGLEIIGLSHDEEEAPILDFARRHGVTFPVALDGDQAIGGRMKVSTLPTTLVFDRSGTQRFRHDGFQDGDPAALEKEILDLLGPP